MQLQDHEPPENDPQAALETWWRLAVVLARLRQNDGEEVWAPLGWSPTLDHIKA